MVNKTSKATDSEWKRWTRNSATTITVIYMNCGEKDFMHIVKYVKIRLMTWLEQISMHCQIPSLRFDFF